MATFETLLFQYTKFMQIDITSPDQYHVIVEGIVGTGSEGELVFDDVVTWRGLFSNQINQIFYYTCCIVPKRVTSW